MSAVVVEALSARYSPAGPDAIEDVRFGLAEGSLTALLGPSGCGKSTVLRAIAGLLAAHRGRVVLEGRDITALPAGRRPVATVLQGSVDFPHMTVRENVAFALRAMDASGAAACRRVDEALRVVGLIDDAQQYPGALPEGRRQLLALARAIVQRRPLLLLDEPLANVDPRIRRALRDEIHAIVRQLALTVLYVTHDRGEALAVADELILMDAGRIVETGSPMQLYRAPRTRFAAEFMGDSTTLTAHRGPDGVVRLGSLELPRLPAGPAGDVAVSFRPEAWALAPVHRPGLAGSITKRSFLGRLVEYGVETPFGPVLVHVPYRGVWLDVAAPVTLQISASSALWISQGAL